MAITQPVIRRSLQVAGVLLLALIGAVAGQQFFSLRSAMQTERQHHLVRLSIGFADQVSQAMAAADVLLRTGAEQWGDEPAGLSESLRRKLVGVPQVLDLTLLSAAGQSVADTRFGTAAALPAAASGC